MAGVNLSQSMSSQVQKKSMFASSGTLISVTLLILTVAGWGGLRFYLYTLDQKIADLDATFSASGGQLQGVEVDRIADFDDRVSFLGQGSSPRLDPKMILTKLEALIVPQVTLTKYEYNVEEQESVISGTTANFRSLAEQVISLKSDPLFTAVEVGDISRGEDGTIEFTLTASL